MDNKFRCFPSLNNPFYQRSHPEIETEVLLICDHSLTYQQLKLYLKTSFDSKDNPTTSQTELKCPNCDAKLELVKNYPDDEAEVYEKCKFRISQFYNSIKRRSEASDELLGYLNS